MAHQEGLLDRYYNERRFIDEDIKRLLPKISPGSGHVEVIFLTHYKLDYDGACLGITGSSEELGEWITPRTMTKCYDGWWAVKVSLPAKMTHEAKLVIHVQSDPKEIIYWELEGRRHRVLNIERRSKMFLLPWDLDEVYTIIAARSTKRRKKQRKPCDSGSEAEVDWSALEEDLTGSPFGGKWRLILCIALPTVVFGTAVAIYFGKTKLSISGVPF